MMSFPVPPQDTIGARKCFRNIDGHTANQSSTWRCTVIHASDLDRAREIRFHDEYVAWTDVRCSDCHLQREWSTSSNLGNFAFRLTAAHYSFPVGCLEIIDLVAFLLE